MINRTCCQDGQGIFLKNIIIFILLTADHGQWERLQGLLLSMVASDTEMRGKTISRKGECSGGGTEEVL